MSTENPGGPSRRRNYRAEVKAGPAARNPKFKSAAKYMLVGTGLVVLVAILIGIGLFVWYGCRVEPGTNEIAILIRKTGDDLEPGEIIATRPGQKGIQLEPLTTGTYFYNPLFWDWVYAPITDIPAGRLGVVTRLYGKDLPHGEIIAPEGYKGIAARVLTPQKHYINPYAEKVEYFDAINITSEEIGIVIHLAGKDSLYEDIPDDMKNVYVVSEEYKGVQEKILEPGTYFLNPYIYSVIKMKTISRSLDLKGDDAITFLTRDGFTVAVEGTIRYVIPREKAPLLTHRVGDHDDIQKKIILPKARGFSRIEGSKHPAVNFIVGETRQEFQNSLREHLVSQCARWGVQILSVQIQNITPPEAVAAIIREREVALQNQRKIEQQIEQARSQAELTRQEMLAVQYREKVESETSALRARIQAEQEQSVQLTSGSRELEVARLEAEAAKLQAESIVIQAEAERDVIKMKNEAEAAVTTAMTDAFGGGVNLARYTLYQKTAPLIQAIISTDRAPGFGGIFQPFMPMEQTFPDAKRPE